ncbi:hypothetical protein SMICM304S_06279 [Streptomyces microflavus]
MQPRVSSPTAATTSRGSSSRRRATGSALIFSAKSVSEAPRDSRTASSVAARQHDAADGRGLHGLVLLAPLPLRLATTTRRTAGTAERTLCATTATGTTRTTAEAGTTAEAAATTGTTGTAAATTRTCRTACCSRRHRHRDDRRNRRHRHRDDRHRRRHRGDRRHRHRDRGHRRGHRRDAGPQRDAPASCPGSDGYRRDRRRDAEPAGGACRPEPDRHLALTVTTLPDAPGPPPASICPVDRGVPGSCSC